MPPTLDHIEKTLADAYRKEIDQEDNVWRTMPFFAAAIAFEITAVWQVFLRLPPQGSGAWLDVISAVVLLAVVLLVAIIFLAASIAPARFSYISDEPSLLEYARALDRDQQTALAQNMAPFEALAVLKATMADQYALATHHNRQINQRRMLWRSVAGLATLGSVVLTIFLVSRLMLHYIPNGS